MKNILLLVILCFNYSLQAQIQDSLAIDFLNNKSFLTNQVIGVTDNLIYAPIGKVIELQEPENNILLGYVTTFKDGKFTSGNFGECGN